MAALLVKEVELFAQFAEARRTYWGIESALRWESPATIVVTSSEPREGKTTVAATLAVIAARHAEKRVLLADLNWYEPSLHRLFGLSLKLDVAALMLKQSVAEMVSPSGMDRLDILTAPQANQNSPEVGRDMGVVGTGIIEDARELYDFIVVDTCSVLRMNRYMMDPVNLAKSADGAVLVVLTGETPRPNVKRTHMLLQTAGVNVLGVVANQWKNPLV